MKPDKRRIPRPHDQAKCTHPDCQFEAEYGYNPADPLGKGDSNVEQPMQVQPNDRPDVQLSVAGASGNVDVPLRVPQSPLDAATRIAELEGQVCRWLDAYADVAAEVTELKARLEQVQADVATAQNAEILALAEVERLRQGWRNAFDAIDKSAGLPGKHFTKYPCECGGQVSNAGWAARSHLRGKAHQAGLAARRIIDDDDSDDGCGAAHS